MKAIDDDKLVHWHQWKSVVREMKGKDSDKNRKGYSKVVNCVTL